MINELLKTFEIEGKVVSQEKCFEETIYKTDKEEIISFYQHEGDFTEESLFKLKLHAEMIWTKFHQKVNVCVITAPDTRFIINQSRTIDSMADFSIKVAPYNVLPLNDIRIIKEECIID